MGAPGLVSPARVVGGLGIYEGVVEPELCFVKLAEGARRWLVMLWWRGGMGASLDLRWARSAGAKDRYEGDSMLFFSWGNFTPRTSLQAVDLLYLLVAMAGVPGHC